ncbi:MAG TPA: ABC transporter permease [Candidatus Sulfotelmatobacter sp.]|nr:ABC transporter permease [Candidatus Sulfotelmatobacter sp.]
MSLLAQDFRYALRQLRKSPGFTILVLGTLALGIGASTAMFGVLNAILLRPLPFRESDRLVRVLSAQNGKVGGPSPLDVRDFAAANHTFEKIVAFDAWRKNVSIANGSTEPEQRPVGLVPAAYFEVLDIKPLFGRLFTEEEQRWGNQFEVIISYAFWQAKFHGDPSVLGKSVRINDEPYTIIAVMPPNLPGWWFSGPHGEIELWAPFTPYATLWEETSRGNRDFSSIGRLKEGVTLAQAQADLERIASNLATRYPADHGVSVLLRPLQRDQEGGLRPTLLLLMGAVILILLIACSNIANLLLARNTRRTREIAVRVAMGAAKWSLVRQFMTENLTLGLLGGTLGCALAYGGCALIVRFHPRQLPQLDIVDIDFAVLMFGFIISVLSSLFFGTLPAGIALQVNPSDAFKESGRTTTSTSQRFGRLFVASEMALAVMLLVGTGLLTRSLLRLQDQQPGFRVDHLMRTHLFLPAVRYPQPAAITRFCDEYAARVRQLPGVSDAVISAAYPPDDQWMQPFSIAGRPVAHPEDLPSATFNVTDSHYLHTLAIPLLKGRDFSDTDTESSQPVALINRTFANTYFPGEDPVGKQIQLGLPQPMVSSTAPNLRLTIIGVIGDTMNRGLALPPAPQLTALFRQTPDLNYGFKNLIVRTVLDPLQLAPSIRQQLHLLDANLPFAEVASMDAIMQQQTSDRRYTTALLILFAVFGVGLAAMGVYGVVSYVVIQRTSEIGLRMALGARRSEILWLVLKQGLRMAAVGTAFGLASAWVLRKTVAELVFGITPADPATFVAAALVLIGFALFASLLPARRATRVDPMVALRYE